MNAATIFRSREQLAQQYESFLFALGGALESALNETDPTSALIRNRLMLSLSRVVSDASRSMEAVVLSEVESLTRIAIERVQQDTGKQLHLDLARRLEQESETTAKEAMDAVRLQMERDASSTLHWFRAFAIEVEGMMRTRGFRRSAAIIAVRQTKQKPKHIAMDTAGRRWQPAKLAKVVLGALLFSSYNRTYLDALTLLGIDRAEAYREDERVVFTILTRVDGEKYLPDIEGRIFHPNSGFLVRYT